jgi:hypothetical protein
MRTYYYHSNDDRLNEEEWPSKFVTAPRVGDYLISKARKGAQISRIMHGEFNGGEPYIWITLI